jgi:drug/metabolite transporter (DMT)-like permease
MGLDWIYIALVAVLWGSYPLITRLSALNGPQASLLLALSSLVPIVIAVFLTGDTSRPTRTQLWPIVVGGLMQGLGLMAFVRVATSKLDASVAIPICDAAMLIVTAVGAIAFFHEAISAQKLAGLGLLVVGILLLIRPT